MLSLLVWLVFGLIVGIIAKFLMPGRDPGGILVTILIGIVGSYIGGGISYLLLGADSPYSPAGWIMSIVGAILLLYVYRLVTKR
jgi:uncharacterized membrane protein YeaQ/YmgE (transglycosylase-associated protein family)